MNKKELIKQMSLDTGIARADCEKALNAFLNIVEQELSWGGEIRLAGFGKFETRERKERIGKNPATKQLMQIKACRVPSFRAGSALKSRVF